MEGKRRHKRLKILLAIVGAVIAVMIIAMAVYFDTYYHSVDVDEYFTGSDTVTVTETDSGWLFDGDGEDTALVFYPGAKVEASAYAPLFLLSEIQMKISGSFRSALLFAKLLPTAE